MINYFTLIKLFRKGSVYSTSTTVIFKLGPVVSLASAVTALMFLPIEGLYAEVLRRPGLCDTLQREHRIVVTGPTTLAALLNSLQMGFRTLAIEKRSSEVWQLLGAVKTEFGKFGQVLAKTKKKLQEASNTIDSAEVRTRAIQRKLRKVQEIPQGDAASPNSSQLGLDEDAD